MTASGYGFFAGAQGRSGIINPMHHTPRKVYTPFAAFPPFLLKRSQPISGRGYKLFVAKNFTT